MFDQATTECTADWTVPGEVAEIKIDAFVRRCLPHLSRRTVKEMIDGKWFRVNGRVARKGQKLNGSDRLEFKGSNDWLKASPIPNAQLAVPVVYEDAVMLALNKPAKMATHGFSARDTTTLANFIVARHPDLAQVGQNRWEPGLVHRLDIGTSGLVLVAKTQPAFKNLRDQLHRHSILKTYLALVWGETESTGSVTYALTHDRRDKRAMKAIVLGSGGSRAQRSWQAATRFRTLARSRGLSLLELEMQTGVMHQLRVHLAARGHPIAGDSLYGANDSERFGLQRHFLHAARLDFCHPGDGRRIRLEARLPPELCEVLDRLGIEV